jgi:peptidyl-prolyl cis-trans isomerase B (cyclophilin B)
VKRIVFLALLAAALVACSHQEASQPGAATTQETGGSAIPKHYRRTYPVALPADLPIVAIVTNTPAGVDTDTAGTTDLGPGTTTIAPSPATPADAMTNPAPVEAAAAADAGSAGTAAPADASVPADNSAATSSASSTPLASTGAPATPAALSELPTTNATPFVAPSAGPPIPVAASPAFNPNQVVVLDTSFGRIVIELDDFAAPKTCANFRKLVSADFYDGTIFHRVIPNFIIQGGDPNTRGADRALYGQGDPGYTLPPEIKLHHDRGAVAMARLPDSVNPQRYSNGSQFYICVAPCPSLDNQYTVFGHVIAGMDVADRISVQPADQRNDPLERITLKATLEPRDRALREDASSGTR